MPKTAVIVLTDAFPFEVGEEFFEQELPYITDSADEFFFIPMRHFSGAKLTRSLPANATALLAPQPTLQNKWLVLARYLPKLLFSSQRFLHSSRKRSFKHLAMDLRFFSNAVDIYTRLRPQLLKLDLQRFDSVVLYSYWLYTGVVVSQLLKTDLLPGKTVKLIARAHAYDIDEDDTPHGYIPARDYLLKVVDEVYPISNFAARFLTERFPQYAQKVSIKRLGVPASPRGSVSPNKPTHLVSVSHMAGYKRVHLIADAVEALENLGYAVKWTHVGEFNTQRLDAMRTYVAAKQLRSEVVLTGHKSNAEVQQFLASENIQIFLNSSSGEGVPVTIMEALANGIPVVATRAGGTAEIVHHGVNGRTLPIDCTGADIAAAVAEIIDAPATDFTQMSQHSLRLWDEYANAEKQYQEMAATLRRLLS